MVWYNQGTVSVTNGSTTVTGSGTAFVVAEVSAGQALLLDRSGERQYEIVDVISATQLTIRPAYQGATATGQTYAVVPVLGPQRAAQRALRDAAEQFEALAQGSFTTGLVITDQGDAVLDASRDGFVINQPVLGTAVIQTPLDNTNGRLLTVGYGGGGGTPIPLTTDMDLNGQLSDGLYSWTGSILNGPGFAGSQLMRVERRSTSNATQFVWTATNTLGNIRRAMRNLTANGNSPWLHDVIRGADTVDNISRQWTIRGDGTVEFRLSAPVDVTSTAAQIVLLPKPIVNGAPLDIIAGSQAVTACNAGTVVPNTALFLNNIRRLQCSTAQVQVQLSNAGTSTDPLSEAERLIFKVTARWL